MADTAVMNGPRLKVVNLSVTVNPHHHEIVEAIRAARAIRGEPIPNKSDVVKQAIERLGITELGAERVEDLAAVS